MKQDKRISSMSIQRPHGGKPVLKMVSALPPKLESYQASEGKKQPLLYKGSIIYIGSDKPTQLDMNLVSYQGKGQLVKAIKDGDIKKVEAQASTKVEGK